MQDQTINWTVMKQHAIDLSKGLLAAVVMGAVQAAVSYVAHIDWNHLLAFSMQAVAAVVAVKTRG